MSIPDAKPGLKLIREVTFYADTNYKPDPRSDYMEISSVGCGAGGGRAKAMFAARDVGPEATVTIDDSESSFGKATTSSPPRTINLIQAYGSGGVPTETFFSASKDGSVTVREYVDTSKPPRKPKKPWWRFW